MFFLSIFQQLLLAYDKYFQFPHSCKSCETRPVWGARQFQALWQLLKGFFILIDYSPEKEGFLKNI